VESHVLLAFLLMEVPGVAWMAIYRSQPARLYVDVSHQSLRRLDSHKFESLLAPHLDDPETAVLGALPHTSAGRVLLVALNRAG